ncbi:MAG: hypothetical protein HY606_12310 [Planctomycetes bacterium]|nr:hypothetical protein [Planctomycetota bacterium]
MSHREQQNNEWLGGVVVPVDCNKLSMSPWTHADKRNETEVSQIIVRVKQTHSKKIVINTDRSRMEK